jgi:hypothetical protein
MKLLTTITAAVLVMAATGCKTMEQKGYIKNKYGDWILPGQPYFGDNPPGVYDESPLLRQARLRNEANPGGVTPPMPNLIPTPPHAPMYGGAAPVVVTGNAPLTTVTPTPFGGTRVVNYGAPAYVPPARPYPYYGY